MGDNVLIPRLPRHGVADRKVENLSPLKAEELRDCADTGVDIACGLGKKVYVAGLSAGGTLSAWIAQNRHEVTRAVLIAPALGFSRREGTRLQKGLALLLPFLPDIRTDWFSVDPDSLDHTYPGFSSRALGQLLRMSVATFAGAFDEAPKVQDVSLVTSKIRRSGQRPSFLATDRSLAFQGAVQVHRRRLSESDENRARHDRSGPKKPANRDRVSDPGEP